MSDGFLCAEDGADMEIVSLLTSHDVNKRAKEEKCWRSAPKAFPVST